MKDNLKELLRDQARNADSQTDLVKEAQRRFQESLDEALDEVKDKLRETDPNLLIDPNPILNHAYPSIDRSPASNSDIVTYEDLHKRNPYKQDNKAVLQETVIGYIGFGGIEGSAALLARDGVGNFVISDHDVFEATNANRQRFASEEHLGRNKAVVGKERLESINSDVDVEAYEEKIGPYDIDSLFDDVDILVDGSGDTSIRDAIHSFRQRTGTPVVSWAWAGFEGQSLVFHEEDPLYTDVFDYSPYSDSRGFTASGTAMLCSQVARDITHEAMELYDSVVSFPDVMTYNLRRPQVMQLRNVHALRSQNAKK